MPQGDGEIEAFRAMLGSARRVVALTGAGISTESGIPDFRSPGGIWSRGVRPITFQDFVASEEARLEDWRRRFRMNEDFAAAHPNAGHLGLARLYDEGRLAGLVTQNIDGLHQRAGIPHQHVIEIHGNSSHARCIACGTAMSLDAARSIIEAERAAPRCACGGLVKVAIVSFGERVPPESLARAAELAARADLFVVLGSSLAVQPAASLPAIAVRAGARLVVVNREPTPVDTLADLSLRESIGTVFDAIYPQPRFVN